MSFGAYRGRLIPNRVFLAEIARVDTAASDFDPVFHAPVITYVNGVRERGTAYQTPIRVRCQVEISNDKRQQQTQGGNTPASRFVLIFHFKDLAALGLVNADGSAMMKPNDKLLAIWQTNGLLEQRFGANTDDKGCLVCTEAAGIGFGLGRRRNLLQSTFEDRPEGV